MNDTVMYVVVFVFIVIISIGVFIMGDAKKKKATPAADGGVSAELTKNLRLTYRGAQLAVGVPIVGLVLSIFCVLYGKLPTEFYQVGLAIVFTGCVMMTTGLSRCAAIVKKEIGSDCGFNIAKLTMAMASIMTFLLMLGVSECTFGIALIHYATFDNLLYSLFMSGCFLAVQPLLCYSMIKSSRKLKGADRLMTALFVTSFVTIFAWIGYTVLPDYCYGPCSHRLGDIFLNIGMDYDYCIREALPYGVDVFGKLVLLACSIWVLSGWKRLKKATYAVNIVAAHVVEVTDAVPEQPKAVKVTETPAAEDTDKKDEPLTDAQRDMIIKMTNDQLMQVLADEDILPKAYVGFAKEILEKRRAWEKIKNRSDEQLLMILTSPSGTYMSVYIEAAAMELYSRKSALLWEHVSMMTPDTLRAMAEGRTAAPEGVVMTARDILSISK